MSVSTDSLTFMPLDLDTFYGSERFMSGTRLGAAFSRGIQAYLNAHYQEAIEHFKTALIAAYVESDERSQIYDRERAIIYLYIGNSWANLNDWSTAQREYLESVQTDPQLAEAHYNLGVAFAALGYMDRAVAAFKEALEHNAALYDAHFALGRAYQYLDDAGRAYIHFTSARELRPQAGEPLYYMGLMHQAHGAIELAQRCFAEALRVEPTFVSPNVTDEVLVDKSEQEVANWYYRLSDDLKMQGYDDEAQRIYQALLQWKPQEMRARYLLGNLLARGRQWEAALTEYRRIPPHDRYYVEAHLRMSAILRFMGHHRDAYRLLYDTAKLRPNDGQIFLQMGKLLYDLEKHQAAMRAFERSVHLLPNDATAHYLLGFMYTTLGHENWALAAWRRAVELAPQAHSLRYDLGYMYTRRRRYDLAAKEFTEVLQAWPDDTETTFMLGVCYKELLEPAQAIPLFEKVLRRNPRHAQALYYLGACYLQVGNSSLGKAYLRRYEHLVNQQPETHISRGGHR